MITLEFPKTEEEKQLLGKWLKKRIPGLSMGAFEPIAFFEKGVGVKAVVAFHNYRKTDIEIVFAAEPGSRWATRDLMGIAMRYPFKIGCSRVTALARKDNKLVRKLLTQLGFKQEGKLRKADIDGSDLFIYGLLEQEYRFFRKDKLMKAA